MLETADADCSQPPCGSSRIGGAQLSNSGVSIPAEDSQWREDDSQQG